MGMAHCPSQCTESSTRSGTGSRPTAPLKSSVPRIASTGGLNTRVQPSRNLRPASKVSPKNHKASSTPMLWTNKTAAVSRSNRLKASGSGT